MSQPIDAAVRALPPDPKQIALALGWVLARTPQEYDHSRLDLGLTEVMTNALLHGVLELTLPEDREPNSVAELMAKRAADPAVAERRIYLAYTRWEHSIQLHVSWNGAVYKQKRRDLSHVSKTAVGGRGLQMIEWCFDSVNWRSDGLGMTLELLPGSATSTYPPHSSPPSAPGNLGNDG